MKRHDFDPVSFVFGVLFMALALFFLSGDRSVADLRAEWIWPIVILLPGLVMLLYGVKSALRASAEASGETPTEPSTEPETPLEHDPTA